MEELTLEDLQNYTVEVVPVEFLGRRSYLRGMTLAGQIAIAGVAKVKGKDTEASDSDMATMLAYMICDSAGNLIFESTEQAIAILTKMDSADLLEMIEQSGEINGRDIAAEKKHLRLTR